MPNFSGSYFAAAGITVAVQADLPITSETFSEKFWPFRVSGPGDDAIVLRHHFTIPPDRPEPEDSNVVFRHHSLTVFPLGDAWIYDRQLTESAGKRRVYHAEFSADHLRADIYHAHDRRWCAGDIEALTLFTTDQMLLARLLADRHGCMVHAAGMELWGGGFLFIGHAGAGKSTTVSMLREHGQVLCDDRSILRRTPDGYRVYGNWCQNFSKVTELSAASAPLRALCFIEQAETNRAIPLTDPREVLGRLLPRVVKPLVTRDWWEKTLATVEDLLHTVPAYRLQRDLSGRVVEVLRAL